MRAGRKSGAHSAIVRRNALRFSALRASPPHDACAWLTSPTRVSIVRALRRPRFRPLMRGMGL
jgi:hypothetical protein